LKHTQSLYHPHNFPSNFPPDILNVHHAHLIKK
jgi:hypothetical protein